MANTNSTQTINEHSTQVDPNEEKLIKIFKVVLGCALVAVIIGFSYNKIFSSSSKEKNEYANSVYEFKSTTFEEFNTDKLKAADFVPKLKSHLETVKNTDGYLSMAPSFYEKLSEKEVSSADLENIFISLKSKSTNSSLSQYKYAEYLSVIQEDAGKIKEAVETLKSVLSSPYIYGSKLYLDIGRMQLSLNENDEAKRNLDHVVKKFPNSEHAKIANILLARLK